MSWLVETIVATTLLMLLVLLVRERVAASFGARAAYLLWLLPALRMVLPPLPESVGATPIARLPSVIDFAMIEVAPALGALPAVQPAIPFGSILLGLWLGGAALLLMQQLFAYHRFVDHALDEAVELPEFDKGPIEVCASRAVEGPFAAGLLTPKVVLPHDWRSRYSKDELRLALRHEVVHHNRGDLPVNFIALTMLALHWFNPVAWFAWRAFRADQEAACDAVVLDGASADERHSYGLALVKSACPRTPVSACSLNPRDQLKRRLRMMRGRERRLGGRALVAVLIGGGLALSASGGIAAEHTQQLGRQITETVETRVIAPVVDAVAAPAPTPPAIPATEPQAAPSAPVALAAPGPVPAAPVAPLTAPSPVVATPAVAPPAPPAPTIAFAMRAPVVAVHRVKLRRGFPFEPGSCPHGMKPVRSRDGKSRCLLPIESAEFREVQIEALIAAREALKEVHGVERAHIAQALAGIEARLAVLKSFESLGEIH